MKLAGVNDNIPPGQDEIEVSLFGPGYGESIVLHLGQKEWVVIDSCHEGTSRISAPLQYLRKIGIDTSTAVKLVIASHWHDDHIRGLGEVFQAAEHSKFVCSAALTRDEFLELVQLSESLMSENTGVREFRKILNLLEERGGSQRKASIGPEFAIEGRVLWKRVNGLPCEINALSPSSAALTLAFKEFSRLIPLTSQTKKRMVAQRPNHVAVVLWVTIGTQSVLLGSDLEETPNPGTGWSVIVGSSVRPAARAKIFKVPHHGSITSDQPKVWTDMLTTSPFALLTPFMSGQMLPTENDIKRIKARTPEAYITAPLKLGAAKFANKTVAKTVKEAVKSIREVPISTGQIRLRCKNVQEATSGWSIELFGTACHLNQVPTA